MTTSAPSSDSAAKPLHTLCSIAPHTSPQTSNPLDTLPDSDRNLRKRKRSSIEDDEYLWEFNDHNGYLPDEEALARPKKRKAETRITCIRPPSFVYPKTAYSGHLPSLPTYAEKRVLQDILAKEERQLDNDSDLDTNSDAFVEADLCDFVIYRPHKPNRRNKSSVTEYPLANEMVSLHEINEHNVKYFCFDGFICYAGRQRYVQNVPFEILSIGGYEEPERSSVGPDIWIQSTEGLRSGIWYRLKHPAAEYQRYHEPFLWMADLAKHLVDYLQAHSGVALSDFRHNFYDWLQNLYHANQCVGWLEKYRDHDFRRIVAAHANFLYCQAVQVDQIYERHPLWEEIHSRIMNAIAEQVEQNTSKDMFTTSTVKDESASKRKTTVTPYVFKCFEKLPWAKLLYCQSSSVSSIAASQEISAVKPTKINPAEQKLEVRIPSGRGASGDSPRAQPKMISVGDVVAIPKDNNSAWKTDDAEYFGYVQSVLNSEKGQALGLLWFYRPGDTTCLKMFYPYSQELFLSDHCNCGDPPVPANEVIRKPQVSFGGLENPFTEFFCRQRYVEGDGAWLTLQDSHFRCGCRNAFEEPQYSVGETLLVASSLRKSGKILEPVVLLEQYPGGLDGKIKILRLLRKGRDYGCQNADANELVLTDKSELIPTACAHRRCQVRFYSEAEKDQRKIPTPYDRQGASDFFYISSLDLQASGSGLEALKPPWPSFIRQGWDPVSSPPQQKMRGLDMFCGGGSFGRGLEDGGAIRFDWAVDWHTQAIHTYKANLKPQNQTKMFRGSVNHYLSQALEGKGDDLIAQFGEIEVICAGNPCQGFSLANPNKGNDRGLLNESMVASVLAFIDFYRPKYALMENVKGMALGDERRNVLAQVVCCLVGMGYQVKTWCLDAWNFGCPQKRSRIIITIAAPGLTPLPEPAQTHSHPEGVRGGSLGKTANGLHTSSRTTSQTPFKYITSAEATKDLPATDARTTCIPFPDHRMSRTLPVVGWVRISSIPRFPNGCSFVKAFKQGYMPQVQIDSFKWEENIRSRHNSRSWQRVSRDGLMPTVMTEPRPDDGAGGTCLHWEDHRLLTIMEVRRAQGFLDREVLIGSPLEQWKIVGNSVARPVALALGVSLRTAWLANTTRNDVPEVQVDSVRENLISGTEDDSKIKRPAVVASEEADRNGWPDMLTKLTAALTSPKEFLTSISNTIKEPLTSRDRHTAQPLDNQPVKLMDSVKVCQTKIEHFSASSYGTKGTSRLRPYRSEQDEIPKNPNTSTVMTQSIFTDYKTEGYGPPTLGISSA